jgi:TrmH family RNA methyltransferase
VERVEVSDAVMRAISLETTPSGIVVVFQMPRMPAKHGTFADAWLILVLDVLRDPGNLGACLRVAAGANCQHVLLAPGSVDPFNPKVVRGGMGAHARIQVLSMPWEGIRAACHGRAIWAAEAGGARRYDQIAWAGETPNALIIGGEASGISDEAHRLATGSITIPLANDVESLNAAVACGVILFEASRQRDFQREGVKIQKH